MGFDLLPPLFEVVPPEKMPLGVMDIASRIKVETVWAEKVYTLTTKYLGSYIHRPRSFVGYLYAALLEDSNVDCLFSISSVNPNVPHPIWSIELSRMAANEQRVYFDGELIVAFPTYTHTPGIGKPGYYIFEVSL